MIFFSIALGWMASYSQFLKFLSCQLRDGEKGEEELSMGKYLNSKVTFEAYKEVAGTRFLWISQC